MVSFDVARNICQALPARHAVHRDGVLALLPGVVKADGDILRCVAVHAAVVFQLGHQGLAHSVVAYFSWRLHSVLGGRVPPECPSGNLSR